MRTDHVLARRLRERRWDLAGALGAVVMLIPTLPYRYGIDQAFYHYVGAGWLTGKLPYRDVFDVKSPGIYAVYAFALGVFGERQSSIRILELIAVLVSGAVIARTTDEKPLDGVFGIAALALATWHATLFGFWDTGQAELWQAMFVVASYGALVEAARGRGAGIAVAGVLASFATLMKPTALLAVAVLTLRVGTRAAKGRRARELSTFAIGLAVPPILVAGYFYAAGAGAPFREWLGYLPHYAAAPLDADWVGWLGPEMAAARCGLCVALLVAACLLRPDPWAVALSIATAAGIAVQRRYFSYHPACLGPVLVLCAAPGIRRSIEGGGGAKPLGAVALLALGLFLGSPPWTGSQAASYRTYVLHAFCPFVFGKLPRAGFDDAFNGPFEYRYADQTAIAELLEERHPAPGDGLHVRGFDPTPYVLTGLRSPSRFAIESPLESEYLSSYAPGWAAEHAHALFGSTAPRFFLAPVGATDELARLEAGGFQPLGSRGRYVALERGLEQHRASRAEVTAALSRRAFAGRLVGAPARARFEDDGSYLLRVGNEPFRGTFRVDDGGAVCLEPEGGGARRCVSIYARDDTFLAFDPDGRELARFSAEL